jgi:serine/threonine protein kinase
LFVFRGLWTSRDLVVAVKKLRLGSLSASAHADFLREARLLRQNRLPSVVALLGVIMEENNFCLVLEYMDRGSLWDFLRRPTPVKNGEPTDSVPRPLGRTLDLGTRLHIAYQAAASIAHLHLMRPPILHCDIKSLNFLLDRHMHVKVGKEQQKYGHQEHAKT